MTDPFTGGSSAPQGYGGYTPGGYAAPAATPSGELAASSAAAAAGWTITADGWKYTGVPDYNFANYAAYGDHGSQRQPNPINVLPKEALLKTQICKVWQEQGPSACPYGARCNYAHGDHELRSIPKMYQTEAAAIMTKTRLCKNWMTTGNCPYRDKCNFAHGDTELREPGQQYYNPSALTHHVPGTTPTAAESLAAASSAAATVGGIGPQVPAKPPPPKKLCRAYTEGNDCDEGDKCTNIHDGEARLAYMVLIGRQNVNEIPSNKYVKISAGVTEDDEKTEGGEPDAKKVKIEPDTPETGYANFVKSISEQLNDMPTFHALSFMHDIYKVLGDIKVAVAKEKIEAKFKAIKNGET